jgi:hypothetical protein
VKRFEGPARIGFIWIWELMGLVGAMSVPIANVLLAIPWGWVFARWAYPGPPQTRGRRAWLLTLHSVLPTLSLTLLPIVLWAGSGGAWDILDPMAAYEYRIPFALVLSFPFNTIFGFYWGVALLAVILKILITTIIARLLLAAMARRERSRQR